MYFLAFIPPGWHHRQRCTCIHCQQLRDRMSFLANFSPALLSVLRIMTGLLVLQHGTAKHLGFPESSMAGVELTSMFGISGVLELVGGVLLVIGLFTRLTAFIL